MCYKYIGIENAQEGTFMEKRNNRYRDLELFLTVLVLLELGFFILFLAVSGAGITAIKVISAIFIFLISAFCLWVLYSSKELLRQRSLWLTYSFCSMALCTLVSILAGYPAP